MNKFLLLILINLCACTNPEALKDGGKAAENRAYRLMIEREKSHVKEINKAVNKGITYASEEKAHPGYLEYFDSKDHEIITGKKVFGDCDDYAITKIRLLQLYGYIDDSRIRFAIVSTYMNGPMNHAVALVNIGGVDYELDNNNQDIRPLNKSPYKYIKTTVMSNEGVWFKAI